MEQIKRLLWLLVAGFITALGACAAIAISIGIFQKYSKDVEAEKYKLDPMQYQRPKDGEILISEIKLATLTNRGGVFGYVENRSKRELRSFSAVLSLSRNGEVVHRCKETATVEVKAGEKGTFQLLCSELNQKEMSADLQPSVSIEWVYPSLDK